MAGIRDLLRIDAALILGDPHSGPLVSSPLVFSGVCSSRDSCSWSRPWGLLCPGGPSRSGRTTGIRTGRRHIPQLWCMASTLLLADVGMNILLIGSVFVKALPEESCSDWKISYLLKYATPRRPHFFYSAVRPLKFYILNGYNYYQLGAALIA